MSLMQGHKIVGEYQIKGSYIDIELVNDRKTKDSALKAKAILKPLMECKAEGESASLTHTVGKASQRR